jgi:signal transduction histidine kinase
MHRAIRAATLGAIVGCITLVAISLLSAWFIQDVQQRNSAAMRQQMDEVIAAEELEIEMREIRSCLNRYLRSNDRAKLNELPRMRKRVDALLGQVRTSSHSPSESETIDALEHSVKDFFKQYPQFTNELPTTEARNGLVDLLDDIMARDIFSQTRKLVSLKLVGMSSRINENRQSANRMGMQLVALGICGAGAGAFAGFALARGIKQSLVELKVTVSNVMGPLDEVVGPVTIASPSSDDMQQTVDSIAARVELVLERFQQSKREIERAGQLSIVGHLSVALAHELRNALMPAKLLVQSALHDGQPLMEEDLAIVSAEIVRIETAVQRLLDFSRPRLPEKTQFDLRALVTEAFRPITGRTTAQGIHIKSELPPDPVLVNADREQLRQVLMNLLLNAIDAMPEGGELLVGIKMQQPPQSMPQVVLTVSDTGVGIPSEIVRRLFEPFATTKKTGTGLGLSICKQIVEAHGGSIQAVNRPERGAVLSVALPATCT